MRFILKILFAPVIAVLAVSIKLCSVIIQISGMILSIIALLFAVVGIVYVVTGTYVNGLILLGITLLLSPFGLPMLAIMLLGCVQRFQYWIQDSIYG